MQVFELDFAKIILLRKDIAEVIIDDGIEIDLAMLNQYHEFLLQRLEAPFALLINKINSYTYSFAAQKKLGSPKQINAMAVVAYRQTTILSTLALEKMPRDRTWNMQLFTERDAALEWLLAQQAAGTGKPDPSPQGDTRLSLGPNLTPAPNTGLNAPSVTPSP
jgi:hypothetical protein